MAKPSTITRTVRGKSTSKAKAETIARKVRRADKFRAAAPITADVYRFETKGTI